MPRLLRSLLCLPDDAAASNGPFCAACLRRESHEPPSRDASGAPRTVPHPHLPPLRLTPYAWAKLLHLRDLGETEVGGFGVCSTRRPAARPRRALVRQHCSPGHRASTTVRWPTSSTARSIRAADRSNSPRIWIHTHPGDSPHPSGTDEETFERCFGNTDWAVMFILARGGQTYARLRFRVGPGGEVVLPVDVDFGQPFPAADQAAWAQEYEQNVCGQELPSPVAFPAGWAAQRLAGFPAGRAHGPGPI